MIIDQLVSLTPSAILEFFEVSVRDLYNYSPLGHEKHLPEEDQGIYRFYAWGQNELENTVIWKGKKYIPYPISVSGFKLEGEKQSPRPVMAVSNLDHLIQDLIVKYEDLVGARLTRKRTFAKFLDKENFVGNKNDSEDTNSQLPDNIYYIRKKQSENIESVTFELCAAWDIEGLRLPRRTMVIDTCPWLYRGLDCGYTGSYYDIADNSTSNESADFCAKHLSSCKVRFGDNPLPFGGFPILQQK